MPRDVQRVAAAGVGLKANHKASEACALQASSPIWKGMFPWRAKPHRRAKRAPVGAATACVGRW